MIRIDQFGMETVDAVTVLIKANRYVQALVVLYAAIDTFAWSTAAADDVTRSDFVAWVSNYMEPTGLGCTADDLYAARCALLHSGTPESRMSREGKASQLWYATSPKGVPTVEKLIRKRGVDAKVIYVTDLLAAFVDGAMKFADELTAQEARRLVITQRINRWLSFVPSAVTAKQLLGE
jgi:hypothetical protein